MIVGCNRCGNCCEGCPHLRRDDADTLVVCGVYDTLPRPCGDDGNFPYNEETRLSLPYPCSVKFEVP